MGSNLVAGGRPFYGLVAGILMLDSRSPRLPGDPGHAQTFSFPVAYSVARGFSLEDMLDYQPERLAPAVEAARQLEAKGVLFVVGDCGLFSIYQEDMARALSVPFVGSSLSLVPLLAGFLPTSRKVGILTGHAGILKEAHLRAAGVDPARVEVAGMESSREFTRVVIERGSDLDVDALRQDTYAAVERLLGEGKNIGAIVVECTNLICFRKDLQLRFGLPVYDLVSLIDLLAAGYRLHSFEPTFITILGEST